MRLYLCASKALTGLPAAACSSGSNRTAKGQKLICQLNSNGEDFEVNLTNVVASTAPQLVTIPFSQFRGKNGGRLDTSAIQHFALYCNTMGDEPVESDFYFDDIHAVKAD